jgi:hypothetical protein
VPGGGFCGSKSDVEGPLIPVGHRAACCSHDHLNGENPVRHAAENVLTVEGEVSHGMPHSMCHCSVCRIARLYIRSF